MDGRIFAAAICWSASAARASVVAACGSVTAACGSVTAARGSVAAARGSVTAARGSVTAARGSAITVPSPAAASSLGVMISDHQIAAADLQTAASDPQTAVSVMDSAVSDSYLVTEYSKTAITNASPVEEVSCKAAKQCCPAVKTKDQAAGEQQIAATWRRTAAAHFRAARITMQPGRSFEAPRSHRQESAGPFREHFQARCRSSQLILKASAALA